MSRTSFNRRAFSLLQVLVGIGVASVALVGLLKMVGTQMNWQRDVASKNDMDDLKRVSLMLLSNSDACTSYLTGKTFNPTAATLANQKLTNVVIHQPNQPTKIVAQNNLKLPSRITLQEVSVSNLAANGANRYTGELVLKAAQDSDSPPITRKIPLSLNTVALNTTTVRVVACTASQPSSSGGGPLPVAILGVQSVYKPTNISQISVSVPVNTQYILMRLHGNFNQGAGWLSEDQTALDAVINLISNTSTGTFTHTGGNGDAATLSWVWNNQSLGSPVNPEAGDTAAWDYLVGYNPRPVFSYDTNTRIFTVSGLYNGGHLEQDVVLFTFLGSL